MLQVILVYMCNFQNHASMYLITSVILSCICTDKLIIISFLRRWLLVPKTFGLIGLYSTASKLQLPVLLMVEEYKVSKAHQVMMLCDNKDVCRKIFTSRQVSNGQPAVHCHQRSSCIMLTWLWQWTRVGLDWATLLGQAKPRKCHGMVQREIWMKLQGS